MTLNLYTGNRMELLVEALGNVLKRSPLSSPFTREVIVVQSKGMQRWLSMELARRFGIWANCSYPFPNKMVGDLFKLHFPTLQDTSSFSKEVMAWKIIRLLPEFLDREPFRPLQHYLADDQDGLKSFQLAGKIADTFDQYTLYRPEMLREWDEASPESAVGGWQGVLWRKLVSGVEGMHRAGLHDEFCRQAGQLQRGKKGIPERMAVFGISSLPQYHLDIFSAVSKVTDLNLFLLSPTREYWADISSRRTIARLPAAERILRTEGNPLLASIGTVGRDFSAMILDMNDESFDREEDLYVDPGEDTLLHALQSDMLNLSGTGEENEKRPIDPLDRSVQIHSCHSPLREIEVLHDNLLRMFDLSSDLTPRDIVVMTTDIEVYSPYITAVFGSGKEGSPLLPFSIADRRLMNEGEIAAALLKLLALHGSRLGAASLFDILSSAPVSRRFQLDEEELGVIRGWIENTRVRWGMDERDRSAAGLPSYRENSWRAGLERLLLGYAMPDEGVLFNDILPYDAIEGSITETLGKFADFIDSVDAFVRNLALPRRLEEWRQFYLDALDRFILPGETSERELASIRDIVDKIGKLALDAQFNAEVTPPVILSWLKGRLEEEQQGLGFMTGGITFCAMLPMRSIPFRVIALVGMNDGAFPRQQRPAGFDLVAGNPRRGDRSIRNEDRYLFLESIVSARDLLYVSYVGQSIRDNSDIPPSVLVSELIDAVRRGFIPPEGQSIEEHLIVKQRLQAFNPEYFTGDDSTLFSYSADNCRALEALQKRERIARPFMNAPLAEPSGEWKTVSLERLLRFYDNPAAFFLEHRLGIRLRQASMPLEEREPFDVEGLDRYLMKEELLEIVLQGGAAETQLPLYRSRGMLPPAQNGERAFREILGDVERFAASVKVKTGGDMPLAPLEIDLAIGEFRLTGSLEALWPQCHLHYRSATLKAKDRIRSWIEHLVLNLAAPDGYPLETVLLMRDGSERYRASPDAIHHLENLLNRYWQGLAVPLSFFPNSSLAYAAKREKDVERRLQAARSAWNDGYKQPGEGSDPAIHRCFGTLEPFGEEFRRIADELLLPMIEAGEGRP